MPAELETEALVALDKLDKIGADGVASELTDRGLPATAVTALADDLASGETEDRVRERLGSTDRGTAGLAEVDQVLDLLGGDLPVAYAPVLARGLSYYTGPVFEVVHGGLDATIAAGGRYDGLVGMFSGTDIPATGGSLGIERILLLLADQYQPSAGPQVLVTVMGEDGAADSLAVAGRLRAGGVATDLWVGGGKLGKQLKHADRRGAAYAVIRGSDERAAGTVAVKHLATGEQTTIDESDLVAHLRARLAAGDAD